jgi:hypothetical protein
MDTIEEPPLISGQQNVGPSSEYNSGQNIDKGQWNT